MRSYSDRVLIVNCPYGRLCESSLAFLNLNTSESMGVESGGGRGDDSTQSKNQRGTSPQKL